MKNVLIKVSWVADFYLSDKQCGELVSFQLIFHSHCIYIYQESHRNSGPVTELIFCANTWLPAIPY